MVLLTGYFRLTKVSEWWWCQCLVRWGHLLPEGAVGKGHGSRHVLQQLHSGCLLHDASYWCPLQLEGSRPSLLSLLQATMCAA